MKKTKIIEITMLSVLLLNSLSTTGALKACAQDVAASNKHVLHSGALASFKSSEGTESSAELQPYRVKQQDNTQKEFSQTMVSTTLSDWDYTTDSISITLTKFKGTGTNLLIPGELGGK